MNEERLQVATEERTAGGREVRIVTASGEVDIYTAETLAASLRSAAEGDVTLLDLTRVPFMDSSGLRVLLVASEERDAPLVLVLSPGSPVRRLLELSEVADRFPTFDTAKDALGAIESSSLE